MSDYDDIVTQEDIDFLHEHARKHYGDPKFVRSSECGWEYTVGDVEVIKTADIDNYTLAQILAAEYGSAYVSEEYTLDILCLMALTEALGLEYGEFVAIDL